MHRNSRSYCIEQVWKGKVLDHLEKHLVDAVNSLTCYQLLYSEAVLANLLEVCLYHEHACQTISDDALLELCDWCHRKLIFLNTYYNKVAAHQPGWLSAYPLLLTLCCILSMIKIWSNNKSDLQAHSMLLLVQTGNLGFIECCVCCESASAQELLARDPMEDLQDQKFEVEFKTALCALTIVRCVHSLRHIPDYKYFYARHRFPTEHLH